MGIGIHTPLHPYTSRDLLNMDSKKSSSSKISEIVRLQQILKKWKKLAINKSPKNTITSTSSSAVSSNNGGGSSKSKKFLKKTLSFTDMSSSGERGDVVVPPKGYLAVCVGKEEMKRFIIPTDYLGHQAFRVLLRQAEEEFGFQQEGVLKIPCQVRVFERILKLLQDKTDHDHDHAFFFHHLINNAPAAADSNGTTTCFSSPSDSELTPSHHPQMCR